MTANPLYRKNPSQLSLSSQIRRVMLDFMQSKMPEISTSDRKRERKTFVERKILWAVAVQISQVLGIL